MNRKELYALLPDPDEVGTAEYRAIHNLLVDAVNEWISHEDNDVSGFALAVLSEVSEWASKLIDDIGKVLYGDPAEQVVVGISYPYHYNQRNT